MAYVFAASGTAMNCKPGGTLAGGSIYTDVGNITTGEDNLMTFALTAGVLAADGDRLEIESAFLCAGNANGKNIKFYFGATNAYATTSLALNGASVVIRATVTRTGAATQKVLVTAQSNSALLTTALLAAYATATETLSGAVTVKFTGEATATDDIIQKMMTVKFFPAM